MDRDALEDEHLSAVEAAALSALLAAGEAAARALEAGVSVDIALDRAGFALEDALTIALSRPYTAAAEAGRQDVAPALEDA